jgi:hypothetical protein
MAHNSGTTYRGPVLRTLLLGLAVAVLAVPAAGAHYAPHGRDCGSIVFQPQTDSGATAIRATRVKCRNARRIVRAWHRGNHNPLRFHCRSRDHDPANGLAHTDVKCTRSNRRVTFAVS